MSNKKYSFGLCEGEVTVTPIKENGEENFDETVVFGTVFIDEKNNTLYLGNWPDEDDKEYETIDSNPDTQVISFIQSLDFGDFDEIIHIDTKEVLQCKK